MLRKIFAIIVFLICLRSSANFAENYDRALRLMFQGKNRFAVIKALKLTISADPDRYEPYHYLAMIYADSDFWNEAIEACEKSLAISPNNIEALYSIGTAHFTLGDWISAEKYLQRAVDLDDQHARSHDLLGRTQAKLEKYHLALKNLTAANSLNPDQLAIELEIGNVCLALKNYENAISHFRKAIEIDPNFAQSFYGLATAFNRSGDRKTGREMMLKFQRLQKAFVEYERLARLTHADPNDLEAWIDYGRLLMKRGDFGEAIVAFERCIELDPKNVGHYLGLSRAFINLGYPVPARNAILRAIELDPNIAILFNTLGSTYAMQGNTEKAIIAFRRAVELDPAQPYFHLNLSRLYEQIGDLKRATEHREHYEDLLRNAQQK